MPCWIPEPLWAFLVLSALAVVGLVYVVCDASILDGLRARIGCRSVSPDASRLDRFVGAMIGCRPCTSAWVAPGAICLVALAWCLPAWLAPWYAVFIMGPICAIGATALITLFSPSSAAGVVFREIDKRRGT